MNGGLVMARRDYYPEYYLKKRQKDALFNRVWKTVIVLVVIALGIGVGVIAYNQIVVHWKQPPDNTEELAGLKGDLEAQERLQNAANQAPPGEVSQAAKQLSAETDLNEISYVQSFPQIHVSVAGSDEPVRRESDSENGQAETASPGSEAPAAQSGDGNRQQPDSSKPKDSDKSDAATKTESKVKEPAAEAQAKPAGAEPSGPAEYEYKIYAGSYTTQESAEQGKRGLGALGLTGRIIKNGADYNLFVGALSDIDAAKALQKKLEDSGYTNSFVTRKVH